MTSFNCDAVLEQLSEYLDDEAREELCRAIEAHLKSCHDCRIYVDEVKKTIVLYQNGSSVELPVRATAQLSAALAREYGAGGPRRAD